MTIVVRLFGRYRDLSPQEAISVELGEGARVRDLVAALHARGMEALPERPVVAVNLSPAPDDQMLKSSDEVALIPPAAGG